MGTMRELEPKDVTPERERSLEIRYRETSVIRSDDLKWLIGAHVELVLPQINTYETQIKDSCSPNL